MSDINNVLKVLKKSVTLDVCTLDLDSINLVTIYAYKLAYYSVGLSIKVILDYVATCI